ncbi:2-hydroxychromene-2-carboxylate isomerase [Micractinium conductrix]|uniref:2-hydroxychromene-2-carboxylate isomerase n=1 Tax=Micractinium conductrix TaxID=554055 RepID=A0A2P6VCP9_9CHLO|nr:2-hydroxychromene-2-carboxylate isomerase [Micractinium conductrix]|eukprot:PSC71831.1 2-hydroxychromene-2-carboxylate isomerase [Micractinium conductrix]
MTWQSCLTASANVSRRLADLPEGSDVDLVLPEELPIAKQVRNLQSSADSATRGKEQQLRAFLQDAASKEHAGSPIVVLPTEPFKGLEQQDFVRLEAAVKVDDTLYVGEHRLVLGEGGVDDIEMKLVKIRAALKRNSSPDLAAALHGVTRVKLFLAGEAVRAGLAVDELVNLAAAVGASVVLPSGQALGLAAEPAPAVQL